MDKADLALLQISEGEHVNGSGGQMQKRYHLYSIMRASLLFCHVMDDCTNLPGESWSSRCPPSELFPREVTISCAGLLSGSDTLSTSVVSWIIYAALMFILTQVNAYILHTTRLPTLRLDLSTTVKRLPSGRLSTGASLTGVTLISKRCRWLPTGSCFLLVEKTENMKKSCTTSAPL